MYLLTAIRGLPPKHRESLFSVIVIAVIMALFITLSVLEIQASATSASNSVYPKFIAKLGYLALAISREATATMAFCLDETNADAYAGMTDTRSSTDKAYADSFQFIEDSKGLHSWSQDVFLANGGTIMTEQGFAPLSYIRSQLVIGEVVLSPQATRERFIEILRLVTSLMSTIAHIHHEEVDFTAFIRANTISSIAYSLLQMEDSTMKYLFFIKQDPNSPQAMQEMKNGLVHILHYQILVNVLLRSIMSGDEFLEFEVKVATVNLDNVIGNFIREVTKGQDLDPAVTIVEREAFHLIEQVMLNLNNHYSSMSEKIQKSTDRLALYLVFTTISILSFLGALSEFIYYRLWDAKKSALIQANANVMHDVLVRVAEYVNEVATFSLAPKPPPKTIADKRTAIVEMELQYLIGSLKALAPSLPPLLFPQRLQQLAMQFSEVKDPATMVLTSPPRDSLKDEHMTLQDAQSESPFLASMAERTDLQEHVHEAALLYVSATCFHDLATEEKKMFATEFFQKIVSTVEECVYQYGGVLHSVSFDKIVGVWNVAEKSAAFCEDAATCALMLANRLSILRAQKRLVRENFPVHIGVVGGTVDAGVFGGENAKTMCIFGPPVVRGMFVAQANGFHMTSVACDDYIRDAIHKIYFCKPIELIPEGGCVHEILQESNRDEPELEVQLVAYKKAFDLFERKYFKGALRAFRAYTKQYGYDSSVERIQALITGSSS